MSYTCGDHVIYSNYGICEVMSHEERPDLQDPKKIKSYYTLRPLNSRLGKVLIPEDRLDCLREAINAKEALDIIDNVRSVAIDEFTDKSHKVIEEHFRKLLRTNDLKSLICVFKSMQKRIDHQHEVGKNPSASYLRLEKEAKTRVYSEIAYALNITETEVDNLIHAKLDKTIESFVN